jgi:hypothetical protein
LKLFERLISSEIPLTPFFKGEKEKLSLFPLWKRGLGGNGSRIEILKMIGFKQMNCSY